MLSLTRSDALSFARVQYQALAQRAVGLLENEKDREAIRQLALLWDARLARLSSLGGAAPLTEDTVGVLLHLAATVGSNLPADVVAEWVDAFPDAVADLFPPSAVTYRLAQSDPSPTRSAARRTTKIALAA